MPCEGAWRWRGVAVAAALGLTLLVLPAPLAWAGDKPDGAPGHSGAGNPGSSEQPSKGDGNSHCAHCAGEAPPPPPPKPDPQPDPAPEPRPDTEPTQVSAPDTGQSPSVDPRADQGTRDEESDESSDTAPDAQPANQLVLNLEPAPRRALPRAVVPVANSRVRSQISSPTMHDLPLALAIVGVAALAVIGARATTAPARLAAATVAVAAKGLGGRSEYFSREDGEVGESPDDRVGRGIGDRSLSWRFPGYRFTDAASVALPPLLARRSPFLARLAGDGSEFRAMFGSLWLLTPIAGAAIGALAVFQGEGHVTAPAVWLLIAGAVIATFDALSGALAAAVFAGGSVINGAVFASGGPDVVHSLLMIFAVSFLWTSLPLIGSAIRPFRRVGQRSLRYTWDRLADLTLASLLCAWIAQQMVGAMDLFLGEPTGLPAHQDAVGLVVLAAVAVRIGFEQLTTTLYPARLMAVEPAAPLPRPPLASQICGVVVRSLTFAFVGFAFTGVCWQWWLGTALFFLPQVLGTMRERFATVPWVQRILPTGLVEIFILIVACTLTVRFALTFSQDEMTTVRWVYLALSVPPAIIGSLAAFTGDGDESNRSTSWKMELAGVVLFVATTWLALRGWDY